MLIASGAGVARIASELTVAPATVKSHIRNIHRKLGSRNRPHAVALGVQLGLIELPPSR
jgi:DNA-binding CsgD family transcriptional regulator